MTTVSELSRSLPVRFHGNSSDKDKQLSVS